MTKNRLEAFSDGVLAIILTIMVLELKVPHETSWQALRALWPVFLSYAISFVYLAIYWVNHHHLLHASDRVNGAVLWANINLLFWLSLVPFTTGWMGENALAPLTVMVYGVSLLLPGVAYFILTRALVRLHGANSAFARALGADFKGIASVVVYAIGAGLASWFPLVSIGLYILVAAAWFIPDRRFERA